MFIFILFLLRTFVAVIEGIDAQPEYGYGVFPAGEEPIKLSFPQDTDGVPAQGVSFHYGRFVQNLRVAARKQKK